MASGIRIKGLDELLRKIGRLDDVLHDDINDVIAAGAYQMNSEAQRNINADALINEGALLAGQQVVKGYDDRTYLVINSTFYAPFQEFGTGARVSVPQGWEELAAQFKGKSNGNFDDFLESISNWVRLKGIDPGVSTAETMGSSRTRYTNVVYAIALSIWKNGLRPRPFLVPAFNKVSPIIVQDVQDVINDALK